MTLSSVFKNHALCTGAIAPAVAATTVAGYYGGLDTVIPSLVLGSIAIAGFRTVKNLASDASSLTRLEPTERWKEIASNMGVHVMPRIYRHESEEENAFVSYRSIVLESELYDNSPSEIIDDTFAHELAHIKRGDGLYRSMANNAVVYSIASACFSLYNMLLFADSSTEAVNLGFSFISFAGATIVTTPLILIDRETIEANHEMEFDCDARAVYATGNVDAGIASHKNFQYGDMSDEKSCFTHPSTNDRIRALEAIKASQNEGANSPSHDIV